MRIDTDPHVFAIGATVGDTLVTIVVNRDELPHLTLEVVTRGREPHALTNSASHAPPVEGPSPRKHGARPGPRSRGLSAVLIAVNVGSYACQERESIRIQMPAEKLMLAKQRGEPLAGRQDEVVM